MKRMLAVSMRFCNRAYLRGNYKGHPDGSNHPIESDSPNHLEMQWFSRYRGAPMTNSFTESVVEDAALEWFGELGYSILHGPEIAPGEPTASTRVSAPSLRTKNASRRGGLSKARNSLRALFRSWKS